MFQARFVGPKQAFGCKTMQRDLNRAGDGVEDSVPVERAEKMNPEPARPRLVSILEDPGCHLSALEAAKKHWTNSTAPAAAIG